ncbi:MAG: hypothetical protein KF819_36505 [Labilithrix sp.]|nr:hypothetical protein [Labilithrix sp.]
MDFAYAAHTEACVFGLDDRGVCRAISPAAGVSEEMLAIAERCLGAQYVASLDRDAEGLLAHHPKPGTRLLFARTEDDGRIVLVRSGPLERFESRDDRPTTPDLPADSEVETKPGHPGGPDTYAPSHVPSASEVETMRRCDEHRSVVIDDETVPFSRLRPVTGDDPDAIGAIDPVTRRSPSTVRAFPPPPAAQLGSHPTTRAWLRHPDRIA